MQPLLDWTMSHLTLGVLVLTRLGMLLMAMPAVGVGVPRRVRLLLAVMLTALLLPTVAERTPADSLPEVAHQVDLALAIAREAMIGMLIGATLQMAITGVQLAGEAITSTGGMQLGDAIDPTTQSSMPSLARLVGMMVTATMLILGGHRLIMTLLVESFMTVPAGRVTLADPMMEVIISAMSGAMASGVRVAGPVLAALLLSNLVTGLISRTMPQINVLAIGLSVNALAMLVVTAMTIGSAAWIFQDDLSRSLGQLQALLAGD